MLMLSFRSDRQLNKVMHIRVFSSNNNEMFWIERHEDKKWPSIIELVEGFVRYCLNLSQDLHQIQLFEYERILKFLLGMRRESSAHLCSLQV